MNDAARKIGADDGDAAVTALERVRNELRAAAKKAPLGPRATTSPTGPARCW